MSAIISSSPRHPIVSPLFDPGRMPPRDALGYHGHPDLDLFCDGSDGGRLIRQKLIDAGLELSLLYLEHDQVGRAQHGVPKVCPKTDFGHTQPNRGEK